MDTRIIEMLHKYGVTKVVCEYSGSGDSGWVETADMFDADDKKVDVEGMISCEKEMASYTPDVGYKIEKVQDTTPIQDALRDLAYDVLESAHPGWEINEGSNGSVVFTVMPTTLKWTIQHNLAFMSYEYYETAGEFK